MSERKSDRERQSERHWDRVSLGSFPMCVFWSWLTVSIWAAHKRAAAVSWGAVRLARAEGEQRGSLTICADGLVLPHDFISDPAAIE